MSVAVTSKEPANLNEIIAGDQEGYKLKIGYSLLLTHRLMGYFPAIVNASGMAIIVFEKDILQAIWKSLPPRRSHVLQTLCYVPEEGNYAFPINLAALDDVLTSESFPVLTRREFEIFKSFQGEPFSWKPGLLGGSWDHTPVSFAAMIDDAIAKLS